MKYNVIFLYLFCTVQLFPTTYKVTHDDFEGGFFSLFHVVVGALHTIDQSKGADGQLTDGLIVDFEQYGFFYDPAYGSNWFSYYFDLGEIGTISDQVIKLTNNQKVKMALNAGLKMSRERGYELIQRYLPLKPILKEKIDQFVKENFAGNYIIGIHYRGTDKSNEALSYDMIAHLMRHDITYLIHNGILENTIKLFIETDDQQFLEYMKNNFPGKVLFIDAIRSSNGNPVHLPSQESNYKKGEDAVLDCLLLSHCSKFYKSESNLSNAVIKFNPLVPVVELNPQVTQYYKTMLASYLN